MKIFLEVLLVLLFDNTTPVPIVFRCLYIAGAWGVLKKSGNKPWYALIPWVREYQLSRCAGREPEGRVFSTVSLFITILLVVSHLTQFDPDNREMVQLAGFLLVCIVWNTR